MGATGQGLGVLSPRNASGNRAGATRNGACLPAEETDTEAAAEEHVSLLLETIQAEIIPRLMIAHRAELPATEEDPGPPATDAQRIDELTRLVLEEDPDAPARQVHRMRGRGVSAERILLGVLAPTARRLGELWSADECTFTDVTLALGRLQVLLWDVSLAQLDEGDAAAREPLGRVLISAAPGEQHTFGASMVSELFRWAGWDVIGGPFASVDALLDTVRAERFDLVGLSLSHQRSLAGIAGDISDIRAVSRNASVRIMVGGPVFLQDPGLAPTVGADSTAATARDGLTEAARLVPQHHLPR